MNKFFEILGENKDSVSSYLEGMIKSGSSIGIVGRQDTGKTSLLYRLMQSIEVGSKLCLLDDTKECVEVLDVLKEGITIVKKEDVYLYDNVIAISDSINKDYPSIINAKNIQFVFTSYCQSAENLLMKIEELLECSSENLVITDIARYCVEVAKDNVGHRYISRIVEYIQVESNGKQNVVIQEMVKWNGNVYIVIE